MLVTTKQTEHPLSPPGEGVERVYENRQLTLFYPLSPTLSLREREFVGQQWVRPD